MRIALIAHDGMKNVMVDWVGRQYRELDRHELVATESTGTMLAERFGLDVQRVASGPLGGDQQIGAMIVDHRVDLMIFFWDPMGLHPHSPDVQALMRLAVLQDIPMALNPASADRVLRSLAANALPESADAAAGRRRTPSVRPGAVGRRTPSGSPTASRTTAGPTVSRRSPASRWAETSSPPSASRRGPWGARRSDRTPTTPSPR
ncbi:methylglyoxal synthase [Streptomyces griseochromogenes]|uniref:Methylglyoxal synthase n=1 Tax=Streptomyces griseochromogenes TaxID=68214 RepID=A0A1B1ANP5_9ACTN|nr:methylglyoxal synthase [Streptomyces griseochromogenes]ANP48192.1 methylglyoxal synthase [Streptomyces griseochromogenes]MBP2050887.1 methylglyoxal synthase [Streptomyces griseochromogenes]